MRPLLFSALALLCTLSAFGQGLDGKDNNRLTPYKLGLDLFGHYDNSKFIQDTTINTRRVGYTIVKQLNANSIVEYYYVGVGDISSLKHSTLLTMNSRSDVELQLTHALIDSCKRHRDLDGLVSKASNNSVIKFVANDKGKLLALVWHYKKHDDNAPDMVACAKMAEAIDSLKIFPRWDSVIGKEFYNLTDSLWTGFLPIM